MKVIELKDLAREEGQIFYIRRYTCEAVLELPKSVESTNINFTIEMNCLGNKTIDLEISKPVDYPLIPLKKAIIDYILEEDQEGRLPC